jgi:basic membrane protein A
MLKRVDVAVYTAIENLINDELVGGEPLTFDLANDGVGYATDGGQLDDHTEQLDELKQQIIDGEIEVPTAP